MLQKRKIGKNQCQYMIELKSEGNPKVHVSIINSQGDQIKGHACSLLIGEGRYQLSTEQDELKK